MQVPQRVDVVVIGGGPAGSFTEAVGCAPRRVASRANAHRAVEPGQDPAARGRCRNDIGDRAGKLIQSSGNRRVTVASGSQRRQLA